MTKYGRAADRTRPTTRPGPLSTPHQDRPSGHLWDTQARRTVSRRWPATPHDTPTFSPVVLADVTDIDTARQAVGLDDSQPWHDVRVCFPGSTQARRRATRPRGEHLRLRR